MENVMQPVTPQEQQVWIDAGVDPEDIEQYQKLLAERFADPEEHGSVFAEREQQITRLFNRFQQKKRAHATSNSTKQ